ncbi:hypothetical protein TGAM01_v210385 [Trichoderma gamsii]|uniref:GST N-terminal domain-containing protein n=1 Tax=Trichoderma gamsii TaxID=398673 RepID=A0A2P4Z904_9HYPO|nr:hypothetical protein TGAM01_v210385 [Trichoderma gamsii]PON20784.1 hypothetical protein TGAM01_v210385 [Trichoderma gamsii]
MAVPSAFTASSGPGGGHFLGVGMDYTVVGMGGYSGLGEDAYHHHAAANVGVDSGDGGDDGRGENDAGTNGRGSGNGNENDRHMAVLEQERRQGSGYRDARHENAMTRQQNQHQYQLSPSSVNHHSYYHNSQHQRQVPPGQFGILKPGPNSASISESSTSALQRPAQDRVLYGRYQNTAPATTGASTAPYKLSQAKLVVDPPDLQAWREKLFHVDDLIILTHEQFETYFPHIDNVYSHRSTQRYKRKPFISHYWDCRMKGRPPGTPKSDDPAKKKRKRSARERDLCDVKIKITEYFPDAGAEAALDRDVAAAIAAGTAAASAVVSTGQRFWTIQRVNGNGGNGKGDGVAGPHRHTLERSDEIKKSSVQRFVAMKDREAKSTHKMPPQKKASGAAKMTIRMHSKEADLKLYAASFCPFSHRVWIALEAKGQPYQYIETDPFKRPAPTPLLEANPRGRVPAIRQGDWACSESAVILEYLEDIYPDIPLFPSDPRLRANCRLWIDHINALLIPTFFSLLQSSSSSSSPTTISNSSSIPSTSSSSLGLLQSHLTALVLAADEQGPYFLGPSLSLVDVHFAPFALRLGRILRHRHPNAVFLLVDAVPDTRWRRWLEALERNTHVQATMHMDDFYLDTADLLIQTPGDGS